MNAGMKAVRRQRQRLAPVRSLLLSAVAVTALLSATTGVRAQDPPAEGVTLATCNVGPESKSCWCLPTLKDGTPNKAKGKCPRKPRNIQKNIITNPSQLGSKRRKFKSHKLMECDQTDPLYSLDGCNPFNNETETCTMPPGHSMSVMGGMGGMSGGTKPVCGVIFADPKVKGRSRCAPRRKYGLKTFENIGELKKRKAILTHTGHCGACSSLQDLSVFMAQPAVSTNLADCAKRMFPSFTLDPVAECLGDLGLSQGCGLLWAQGLLAAASCLSVCFDVLDKPWLLENNPDTCVRHACIKCRDDLTDEILTMYGGRSFTNSALRSPLIEQCGKLRKSQSVKHNPCDKKFEPTLTCGTGTGVVAPASVSTRANVFEG